MPEEYKFKFEIGQEPVWLITQDGVIRTKVTGRTILSTEDGNNPLYQVIDPYENDNRIFSSEDHLYDDFVVAAKCFYKAFSNES